MNLGQGLPKSLVYSVLLGGLMLALMVPACQMETGKTNEEMRKEIQELKSEVTALKEKVTQLQASQQVILGLLKKSEAPPMATFTPPVPTPAQEATPLQGGPQPLTVSQLLAGKDRYLGTRVTVRGPVGPVLVHHKSLLLKAPEGLVEVFFGKLPDEKQVQRLTSSTLDNPITVTGMVGPSPKGGAKLEIQAEAIEF